MFNFKVDPSQARALQTETRGHSLDKLACNSLDKHTWLNLAHLCVLVHITSFLRQFETFLETEIYNNQILSRDKNLQIII